jgi:hypothetical protein
LPPDQIIKFPEHYKAGNFTGEEIKKTGIYFTAFHHFGDPGASGAPTRAIVAGPDQNLIERPALEVDSGKSTLSTYR